MTHNLYVQQHKYTRRTHACNRRRKKLFTRREYQKIYLNCVCVWENCAMHFLCSCKAIADTHTYTRELLAHTHAHGARVAHNWITNETVCEWFLCIPTESPLQIRMTFLYIDVRHINTYSSRWYIYIQHILSHSLVMVLVAAAVAAVAAAAAELDVIVCRIVWFYTDLLLWRQSSGNLCMLWFTLVTSSRWTNIVLNTSHGQSVYACTVPNLIRWLHSSYIKPNEKKLKKKKIKENKKLKLIDPQPKWVRKIRFEQFEWMKNREFFIDR